MASDPFFLRSIWRSEQKTWDTLEKHGIQAQDSTRPQVAPGVTEKFITRINKDSKGIVKLPVRGVESGQPGSEENGEGVGLDGAWK